VKAEREWERLPGYFDIEGVRAADTIGAFDEAYIAKIYGFRDKFHYYQACGAKGWLHRIRVPAIAINALDDPFIDRASLPTQDSVQDAPVRLVYHEHGGHCGFRTSQSSMLGTPTSPSAPPRIPVPAHGWLAEELARAVAHLHCGAPQEQEQE